MTVKFYSLSFSPPCRAVWMALELLNVDYEYIAVDLFNGEHYSPEFLKVRKWKI